MSERTCILCGSPTEGTAVCPGRCRPAPPPEKPKPAGKRTRKPNGSQRLTVGAPRRYTTPIEAPRMDPTPAPPPLPAGRMKCGCPLPAGMPAYLAASMVCRKHAGDGGILEPNSPEAFERIRQIRETELATKESNPRRPRKGARPEPDLAVAT